MAILTTLIMAAASAGVIYTAVNNFAGDIIQSYSPLKPINRTILQSYTTDHTQAETKRYIATTVKTIYKGALEAAALRKEGYRYPFNPLLPIHTYPPSTYVPVIVERLKELFPECDIEINQRLGFYNIAWAPNARS